MNKSVTIPKIEPEISLEAINEIKRILKSGSNVKISTGKRGVTVYEERVTIAYPQS